MSETRQKLTEAMKASMKAGNAPRTSTIRMMMAKIKDADIAARPRGADSIGEDEVLGVLRGIVKARREAILLYEQGHRPELAAKEAAEITVIEAFLPAAMDDSALAEAVAAAVREAGATSPKDMGRVMAALKARHGAQLDMARANPLVRAALAGP